MDGSSICRRQSSPRYAPLLSFDGLRAKLRAVGEERYHHQHPFHLMMHEGRLNRGQLQAWALNRYYYQSMIPIKDSIILSRGPDPAFRRAWRKRVIDHDGDGHSRRRHQALAEARRSHWTQSRSGARRNWDSSRDALRRE